MAPVTQKENVSRLVVEFVFVSVMTVCGGGAMTNLTAPLQFIVSLGTVIASKLVGRVRSIVWISRGFLSAASTVSGVWCLQFHAAITATAAVQFVPALLPRVLPFPHELRIAQQNG